MQPLGTAAESLEGSKKRVEGSSSSEDYFDYTVIGSRVWCIGPNLTIRIIGGAHAHA